MDNYAVTDAFGLYRILLPILSTTIYLLLYPWVRNWVYDYWSYMQSKMENIRVKNLKKRTIPEDEKIELIESRLELEKKYGEDIKERDDLNQLLKNKIDILESNYDSLEEQYKLLTIQPSSNTPKEVVLRLILQTLQDNTGSLFSDNLWRSISTTYGVEWDEYRSKLALAASDGLVKIVDQGDTSNVLITHAGKKYLFNTRKLK